MLRRTLEGPKLKGLSVHSGIYNYHIPNGSLAIGDSPLAQFLEEETERRKEKKKKKKRGGKKKKEEEEEEEEEGCDKEGKENDGRGK